MYMGYTHKLGMHSQLKHAACVHFLEVHKINTTVCLRLQCSACGVRGAAALVGVRAKGVSVLP